MRIVVCVKQVPVVSAMTFDPTSRTLRREDIPCEVSSFDLRALIKAIDLRTEHGGEVVALTMGPPQARQALIECLALGADRAIHLCDRAFAGADTLATARALALAVRREAFDLILCGRYSVDAETGQVGPEMAELLGISQVTAAETLIVDSAQRTIYAKRETDFGSETVVAPLPALVTATEDLAAERFPSKADREAAKAKPCVEIAALELSADINQFGHTGSPTWVSDLHSIDSTRSAKIISTDSIDASTAELARMLVQEHGLFGSLRTREQPAIADIAVQARRVTNGEVWVVAETLSNKVRPVTLELLAKARDLSRALGSQAAAILLGSGVACHTTELTAQGADKVYVAEHPLLSPFDVETHTAVLADAIRTHGPKILLFGATSVGRDLAPRLAARLQVGLTGDCIDVGLDPDGRLIQYKPAFGGSIVAPIFSKTLPEMATVRGGMLRPIRADTRRPVCVENLTLREMVPPRLTISSQETIGSVGVDLDNAEIVIGLGKGFSRADNFKDARELSLLLGASICTTRDVADEKWLPRQLQVGLTGRAIAPKLYIAIAIRGAFEHMVGVRRAGLIVAVNKNPKAPVFKSADYGIVGDYREVLPALTKHLRSERDKRNG